MVVEGVLRAGLAPGTHPPDHAAALGLAFARQDAWLEALTTASARQEGQAKEAMDRCIDVLKGGNLDTLADDYARVGQDRLRRERFFGLEVSDE
jgi:hypothetical protein